jgi:hypothetical protein
MSTKNNVDKNNMSTKKTRMFQKSLNWFTLHKCTKSCFWLLLCENSLVTDDVVVVDVVAVAEDVVLDDEGIDFLPIIRVR